MIPKDAEAVVQVQVRSLEKYFLHDVISNPMSYITSDNKPKQDSVVNKGTKESSKTPAKVKLMEGLAVPKSLLFYRKDNTWFSSGVEIKDVSKVEKFLSQNNYEAQSGEDKIYRKKKRSIRIEDNQLRLAYGGDSGKASKGLAKKDESFLSKGDQLFDATLSAEGDIAFTDSQGQFLNVNFGAGKIDIDGQYNIKALQPSANEVSTEGIGVLSANLDMPEFRNLLSQAHKEKFSNFTKLRLDSLAQHMNGDVGVVLKDFAMSVDTITTYEYDDNFNKVEVKEVKENLAPSYSLALGMDEEAVSYMKRQKAIVEQEGKEVLAIMPLVPTYCKQSQEALYLYTVDMPNEANQASASNLKMEFALDVDKYLAASENSTASWNKQLQDISKMNLTIDNEDKIRGRILFQDNRNSLVSLVK